MLVTLSLQVKCVIDRRASTRMCETYICQLIANQYVFTHTKEFPCALTDYLTILTLFFSKNLYGLNVIGFHVYNCMTMHYDLRNRKLHTLIVKHTLLKFRLYDIDFT